MWMQHKSTAESEHNLKAFCRPVTLTDSSTLTFIHLFTLCFRLWFVPMAHALGLSDRFINSFSRSSLRFQGWIVFFISECIWRVKGESGYWRAVQRSVAGEFLLILVSWQSTAKLDLGRDILLFITSKDKTFTWIPVHVFMLKYIFISTANSGSILSLHQKSNLKNIKFCCHFKTLQSIKYQCKKNK